MGKLSDKFLGAFNLKDDEYDDEYDDDEYDDEGYDYEEYDDDGYDSEYVYGNDYYEMIIK